MHQSALNFGRLFFDVYSPAFPAATVVDIGSQDVNGSLKTVCPAGFRYVGVDFVHGNNVDVVLEDPYRLPFADNSIDMVVSSSCFEHSELFWVLFLEIVRVLRPGGLFYLNVPSNGMFHRYPVDCWRFYPDSGRALVTWARRNGHDVALLESFVGRQSPVAEGWNDFIAVFLKGSAQAARFPQRISARHRDLFNVSGSDVAELENAEAFSEDQIRIFVLESQLRERTGELERLTALLSERDRELSRLAPSAPQTIGAVLRSAVAQTAGVVATQLKRRWRKRA